MTISKKWTIHEKDTLRKFLMIFGFHRWDQIKKNTSGILNEKTDTEMRAFSNSFLRCVIDNLAADKADLKEFLIGLIKEEPEDPLVVSHPDDWGVLMQQKSAAWGKRIQLIHRVNQIVEKFQTEQSKNNNLREEAKKEPDSEKKEAILDKINPTYDIWDNLLNFVPANAFYGQRPAGWWTRVHDIDLLRGTYKWGYANYNNMRADEELSFSQMEKDASFQEFPNADTITRRLKKLIQIISKSEGNDGTLNFEDDSAAKEPTGFNLIEKLSILKVLTNVGIPITIDGKDDWNKLKDAILRQYPQFSLKNIQTLERVTQRLRMIAQLVLQIKETQGGSAQTDYSRQLDPDSDGFSMTVEQAKSLTKNINLLSLIRKFILQGNSKFIQNTLNALQDNLPKYLQMGYALPQNWEAPVHDRFLSKKRLVSRCKRQWNQFHKQSVQQPALQLRKCLTKQNFLPRKTNY